MDALEAVYRVRGYSLVEIQVKIKCCVGGVQLSHEFIC